MHPGQEPSADLAAPPHPWRRRVLIAGPAMAWCLGSAAADPAPDDPRPAALARLQPSVVGVEVFARGAASAGEARPLRAGTGLVVSADGWVLTAASIVQQPGDILVRTEGGGRQVARLLGVDRRTDLAVLQIAPGVPHVVLDSPPPPEDMAAGEAVWTVGREDIGEAARTVSRPGQITAAELPPRALVPYIQTDAPLLPAMGGGPLVNQRSGRVLGINALQYAPQGQPRSTFSTPIADWLALTADLRQYGRVRQTSIGSSVQDLTKELAAGMGIADITGVLVVGVTAEGPAQTGGLRAGDVVLSIDGQAVRTGAAYFNQINRRRPGDTLQLRVLRAKRFLELSITAGESPRSAVR